MIPINLNRPNEKYKIIKCHSGCICCICENRSEDETLVKQFIDTVYCIQENNKCIDIKRITYHEDI